MFKIESALFSFSSPGEDEEVESSKQFSSLVLVRLLIHAPVLMLMYVHTNSKPFR